VEWLARWEKGHEGGLRRYGFLGPSFEEGRDLDAGPVPVSQQGRREPVEGARRQKRPRSSAPMRIPDSNVGLHVQLLVGTQVLTLCHQQWSATAVCDLGVWTT
jgi:hypothetical protein